MSARGKRARQAQAPDIDPLRARHLTLARRQLVTEQGRSTVVVDEAESPLVWLARRRGRGGQALIETHQLQAGERLRRDFTYAHLMPRTTSNLTNPLPVTSNRGSGGAAVFTETMIAARQRVHHALDAVGPEFGGLLLDVCCFLTSLNDIERDRAWPARSGKVVLRLALDRLARHYGYAAQVRGRRRVPVRTWLADDAQFRVEEFE